MYAADLQNYSAALVICRILVAAGANLDKVNWLGATALMISLDAGGVEIAELLIMAGANIHLADNQGCTAAHYACKRGLARACELLNARGADFTALSRSLQKAPLHYACQGAGSQGGSLATVRFLLNNTPAGTRVPDCNGNTPLHAAAAAAVGPDADAIALTLVARDVHALHSCKNNDGLTAVQHGRRMGHSQRVQAMHTRACMLRRWAAFRMISLVSVDRAVSWEALAQAQENSRGPQAGTATDGQAASSPAHPPPPLHPSSHGSDGWSWLFTRISHRPDLTKYVFLYV